jgi:hypothetical protein
MLAFFLKRQHVSSTFHFRNFQSQNSIRPILSTLSPASSRLLPRRAGPPQRSEPLSSAFHISNIKSGHLIQTSSTFGPLQCRYFGSGPFPSGEEGPNWSRVPLSEKLKILGLGITGLCAVVYLIYLSSGAIVFLVLFFVLIKVIGKLSRILERLFYKLKGDLDTRKSVSHIDTLPGRKNQRNASNPQHPDVDHQPDPSIFEQPQGSGSSRSRRTPTNEGGWGLASRLVPGLVKELGKIGNLPPAARAGLGLLGKVLPSLLRMMEGQQQRLQSCYSAAAQAVESSMSAADALGTDIRCTPAHHMQSSQTNGRSQVQLTFSASGSRAQGVVSAIFDGEGEMPPMTSLILEVNGSQIDLMQDGRRGGGSGRSQRGQKE